MKLPFKFSLRWERGVARQRGKKEGHSGRRNGLFEDNEARRSTIHLNKFTRPGVCTVSGKISWHEGGDRSCGIT